MIAVVTAALGLASGAAAQTDAAQKAKEGGIDHWIEYYKAEQRKPGAVSPPESTTLPADRTVPVERVGPDTSAQDKTERK